MHRTLLLSKYAILEQSQMCLPNGTTIESSHTAELDIPEVRADE
jgi:hypothetical protein